jgi:hypothetical protein
MTKREALRRTMMSDVLRSMGFSPTEAEQLRRISLTLSSWGERECNEDIRIGFYRVDGEFVDAEAADPAHRRYCRTFTFGQGNFRGYQIPNREAGALRRLKGIMANHRGLLAYHQTDPRGAALYIIRRTRLREYAAQSRWADRKGLDGKPLPTHALLDSCYSSVGLAVY